MADKPTPANSDPVNFQYSNGFTGFVPYGVAQALIGRGQGKIIPGDAPPVTPPKDAE